MGRRRSSAALALVVLLAMCGALAVPGPIRSRSDGAGADVPSPRTIESATWDWLAAGQGVDDEVSVGPGRSGNVLRWPDGARARFVINPEGAPTGAVTAVRNAVATWMRTGVDVSLDYGGLTDEHGASPDIVNVVSFVDTPRAGDVFVARTTTYWFADAPEEIIGFDLVFNLDHEFGTGAADSTGWDVETIALHEFGHVLGLGHADPERVLQVMRPRISAGEVDRSLSLRDVEALASLYGDEYAPAPQGFFVPAPQRTFRDAGSGHRPEEPGLFD